MRVLVGERTERVALDATVSSSELGAAAESPIAAAPLAIVQSLAGLHGHVTRVLVQPQPGHERAVRSELSKRFGGSLNVRSVDTEAKLLGAAAGPEKEVTLLFGAISLLAGIILAFNALLLASEERGRFIAYLLETGTPDGLIVASLAFDALILGVIGSRHRARGRGRDLAHRLQDSPGVYRGGVRYRRAARDRYRDGPASARWWHGGSIHSGEHPRVCDPSRERCHRTRRGRTDALPHPQATRIGRGGVRMRCSTVLRLGRDSAACAQPDRRCAAWADRRSRGLPADDRALPACSRRSRLATLGRPERASVGSRAARVANAVNRAARDWGRCRAADGRYRRVSGGMSDTPRHAERPICCPAPVCG
jgi:hypothetical protein